MVDNIVAYGFLVILGSVVETVLSWECAEVIHKASDGGRPLVLPVDDVYSSYELTRFQCLHACNMMFVIFHTVGITSAFTSGYTEVQESTLLQTSGVPPLHQWR